MKMTLEEIADRVNVSTFTLKTYLCRADFASARTKSIYLYDITEEQLEHLYELIHNRIGAKRNTYRTWDE